VLGGTFPVCRQVGNEKSSFRRFRTQLLRFRTPAIDVFVAIREKGPYPCRIRMVDNIGLMEEGITTSGAVILKTFPLRYFECGFPK